MEKQPMTLPLDFAAVQWARKMTALTGPLAGLKADDLRKLGGFLQKLADFTAAGGELSPEQAQVIMQNLHAKTLVRFDPDKGGALVEFTGGGFEYERFLIRADGKMPNSRYEAKKR
jgi:signal transduction protein with GAF and PtsI domain